MTNRAVACLPPVPFWGGAAPSRLASRVETGLDFLVLG
jgi:hypothetical protein